MSQVVCSKLFLRRLRIDYKKSFISQSLQTLQSKHQGIHKHQDKILKLFSDALGPKP